MSPLREITVIGAGVVGITTAVKLQETGKYHVIIVGEVLPTDPKTIKYTSQWAGAIHYSSPEHDKYTFDLDKESYQVFSELADGEASHCIMRVMHQDHYMNEDIGFNPSSFNWLPKFRYLNKDELKPGCHLGMTFESFTIDVPIYLSYLQSRFEAGGGKIVRGMVQHIDSLIKGGPCIFDSRLTTKVDAVIVCPGLGSRTLLGVEDKDVFPIRGQTIRLHAPWVNTTCIVHGPGPKFAQYFPRKGGDILVGGVSEENDWHPIPRLETRDEILERAISIFPEIFSEEQQPPIPSITEILPSIIENGCGLRPARRGGVRIEAERRKFSGKQATLPVVHNYGHSGSGYQASWGSASKVLNLLNASFD